MRIITPEPFKVFEFSELSPKAKANAIEAHRTTLVDDNFWWEQVKEDFVYNLAPLLGIDIKSTDDVHAELHCQGAGARFAGDYEQEPGVANKVRDDRPNATKLHAIADVLDEEYRVAQKQGQRLHATITFKYGSRYYHWNTVDIEVFDEEGEEVENESIVDAMKDLMRWLYDRLDAEWDYLVSDETISNWLSESDTEFLEDGKAVFVEYTPPKMSTLQRVWAWVKGWFQPLRKLIN